MKSETTFRRDASVHSAAASLTPRSASRVTSGSLSSALLLPPSTCDQWAESMCLFVESSLRTLNAHFESGVTRASLSNVRRQLMSDIADYAMESGASLTHVEVAVDLLLLRACGTYAISPPGSRDREGAQP